MIDFLDKECPALFERLSPLVYAEDCVLCCTDPAAAQAIVDDFSIDDAREGVLAEISAYARDLRDQLTAGVAVGEMASWSIKLADAKAYLKSGVAEDAPAIAKEAAYRKTSVAELSARVLANADALVESEAAIAGIAGKHRDAVAGLGSIREVVEYDWRVGWPER